jgi:hypothetical protein
MTGRRLHAAAKVAWGWWDNARCKGVTIGGVEFDEVQRKVDVDRARNVCAQCPVARQCLDEAMALEHGIGRNYLFGFQGGLTRRERFLLRREAS